MIAVRYVFSSWQLTRLLSTSLHFPIALYNAHGVRWPYMYIDLMPALSAPTRSNHRNRLAYADLYVIMKQ